MRQFRLIAFPSFQPGTGAHAAHPEDGKNTGHPPPSTYPDEYDERLERVSLALGDRGAPGFRLSRESYATAGRSEGFRISVRNRTGKRTRGIDHGTPAGAHVNRNAVLASLRLSTNPLWCTLAEHTGGSSSLHDLDPAANPRIPFPLGIRVVEVTLAVGPDGSANAANLSPMFYRLHPR